MRVSILTQYYPPEIGAPQARLSYLAKYLAGRGHSVHVLTAMPNYPHGVIRDGYGGFLKKEQIDEAIVTRTFIYPAQSAKMLPRMANYLSFAASSAMLGPFATPAADYLMVESPPLFLGLSGYCLSRLKSARLIFNVSDLWPESAVQLGVLRRDSLAFRLASWLERACYRAAWLVTGQSRTIVNDITQRFPGTKTFHLSNGVDTTTFSPDKKTLAARSVLGDGKFIAVYAGLHGLAQGLEQILDTWACLGASNHAQCVFIGDGPEKGQLIARAKALGLSNVRFLSPRPAAEIPPLLAAADVIFAPLKIAIPGAVPSKLYEAMSSGRPVVLMGTGEAAEIVQTAGAGITVQPGAVPDIAAAIRQLESSPSLARQLGLNGRRAAVENYDRKRIADRFIDYLEGHAVEKAAV